MSETGTITIERRNDGAYLVGDPAPVIDIARELLDNYDPTLMQIDGDLITFTLTNGTWRYQITEHHERTVRAALEVTR